MTGFPAPEPHVMRLKQSLDAARAGPVAPGQFALSGPTQELVDQRGGLGLADALRQARSLFWLETMLHALGNDRHVIPGHGHLQEASDPGRGVRQGLLEVHPIGFRVFAVCAHLRRVVIVLGERLRQAPYGTGSSRTGAGPVRWGQPKATASNSPTRAVRTRARLWVTSVVHNCYIGSD